MSKKKLLNSVVALGTAAAMVLGGTFAWQSISQTAVNEASDIVNPGGRLHNDLAYIDAKNTDANIYVENFTDKETGDDIFARVRLSEYMEIVMNYGSDAAVVETVAGAKYEIGEGGTPGELADSVATKKGEYIYDYAIHYFGLGDEDLADGTENNKTYTYWTLNAGNEDSSAVYMPTFNKNKDSLMADLNGLYDERVGGISNRGESQYSNGRADYEAGNETTAWAIYDADYNIIDELKDLTIDQLNQIIFGDIGDADKGGTKADCWNEDFAEAVNLVSEKHTAANVGETKGLISMTAWLEKYEAAEKDENGKLTADGESAVYGYWVYDDSEGGNGWVYWSSPIKPGTTTGLLLDSFTLNQVMDDTWYYAIDVEGQFVTANDLGRGNKTGFYTTDDDQPTENAEKLLAAIGVTLDEKDDTKVLKMQDAASYGMTSTVAYISVKSGDTFRVKNTNGSTPSETSLSVSLRGGSSLEAGTDYTYENGLLTITAPEDAEWLNENGTALQVSANDFDANANGVAQIIFGDDGKLTLNTDSSSTHGTDITIAQLNKGVTVKDKNGNDPTGVSVAYEYESDNGGYTYENGTLTITNADYVGKVLKVTNNDETNPGYGFVLVTAASTSDGDLPDGGGQTDEDEEDDGLTHTLTASNQYDNLAVTGSGAEVIFQNVLFDDTRVEKADWQYLTATFYKKGETENPVATVPGSDFEEEDSLWGKITLGLSYIPAGQTTEYDMYLSYNKNGAKAKLETPFTITVNYEQYVLKEGGNEITLAYENFNDKAVLVVEGVDDPWAEFSTAKELQNAMTITIDGEVKYTGWWDETTPSYSAFNIDGRFGAGFVGVYFEEGHSGTILLVNFLGPYGSKVNDNMTVTITIGGKDYSMTLKQAATEE